MAKSFGSAVLDNGLDYPRARAAAGDTITLHVIKAYTAGDSYSTVVGNSVGSVALAAGDLVLANDSTTGRKVTVAAKSIASASASSGASPALHIAVVNTTASVVFLVTEVSAATNQIITSGNALTTSAMAFSLGFAAT